MMFRFEAICTLNDQEDYMENIPPRVCSCLYNSLGPCQKVEITKLETDIDKPERGLSSGRMLCTRLSCPNRELNTLGPPTIRALLLITVQLVTLH